MGKKVVGEGEQEGEQEGEGEGEQEEEENSNKKEKDNNINTQQPEITSSLQNHFEVDRTSKSTITVQTLQTLPISGMKENCLSDEVVQSAENNTFSENHTNTNTNTNFE